MNTCEYPTHDSRKLKRFLSELKQRSEPLEMWQTHDLARGLAATPAVATPPTPLSPRPLPFPCTEHLQCPASH